MTVSMLLENISSSEIEEWKAYYAVQREDEKEASLKQTLETSVTSNMAMLKGKR